MFAEGLLLLTTVLFIYACAGCWILQVVCYPTYSLVGEREFVPFHVAFGKQLIPVFVVPAVLGCWAAFVLVFFHPATMPLWAALLVALLALIILVTTLAVEVPKHTALDKGGKSQALIDGLVRDNLPRAVSWSIGCVVLLIALVAVR